MKVEIAYLPSVLPPLQGTGVTVVVFDVLRATTTMAAALAAGVEEIRVYGSTAEARTAGDVAGANVLLCGEEQCLPPAGFHLGNSPGAFSGSDHRGRTVYMSTTNGTRAILAARGAGRMLVGALVNACAVARAVSEIGQDVILLCAGTNGVVAAEDIIGAGAVLHALRPIAQVRPQADVCWMSEDLYVAHRSDLANALRTAKGGQNVIAAGLEADIEFAARLDALDVVGEVHPGSPPVVRRYTPAT
jgi:2-phosphosulfolactate phosphatase